MEMFQVFNLKNKEIFFIVYAFSTLISTAPPQAIAEHLHQRWLADQNFSVIAPKIVYQMSDVSLIFIF